MIIINLLCSFQPSTNVCGVVNHENEIYMYVYHEKARAWKMSMIDFLVLGYDLTYIIRGWNIVWMWW